jgi:alpha-1,6-mannosyltransferase
MVLFALPVLVIWLYTGEFGVRTIMDAIVAGVIALAVTIGVDSVFWGVWCWPEFDVLNFNTVENRSSEWGVQPWPWYFIYVIPRIFMTLIPFLLSGVKQIITPKTKHVAVISVGYIFLYSMLPHKEVRFILPVVPGLTLLAANGAHTWYLTAKTSKIVRMTTIAIVGMSVICLVLSVMGVYVSSMNYPGADAIGLVTKAEGPVHISVYPA